MVVSGGGGAVGDLEERSRALELDNVSVVCLAGRGEASACVSARVRRRAAGDGARVHRDDERLLAGADVLVHSTGGVTCLEALGRDCPIVAYGGPSAPAPLLARDLAALGLVATLARTRSCGQRCRDGRAGLRRARRGRDAASIVLTTLPRVIVRLRARLARTSHDTAALVVMLFALFASDATYPMVAEALALPKSTALSTAGDAVAVVVRGSTSELLTLAPIARRAHLRGSVAASARLTAKDVAALRAAGLDPIPELSVSGVAASFDARGQLRGRSPATGSAGTSTTSRLARASRRRLHARPRARWCARFRPAATSQPAGANSARFIPER